MKKIIFSLLLAATIGPTLTAQSGDGGPLRFGFQFSPVLSFMHSNSRDVNGSGVNLGLNMGLVGEYYFNDNRNYAVVLGASFILNKGGTLKYTEAGDHLSRSDYSSGLTAALTDTTNGFSRTFAAGSSVANRINFVHVPIGLKMRTNYLFGSDFRAFAQVPMLGLDIATSARGDVRLGDRPDELFEKETIYPDISPVGLTIGGGLGVEWYPQDEQMSVVAGIFYNGGLLDLTRSGSMSTTNAKATISDVTIRMGIMF
jgi:hypothetical protein